MRIVSVEHICSTSRAVRSTAEDDDRVHARDVSGKARPCGLPKGKQAEIISVVIVRELIMQPGADVSFRRRDTRWIIPELRSGGDSLLMKLGP